MIKRTRAEISKCIIHKVANKYNSGSNAFSENLINFDEASYDILLPFLLKPFSAITQSYRFTEHLDVRLNEMNKHATAIFDNEDEFLTESKNIANHLFEQSNSAQIKSGDLLVVLFEGLEYKDMLVQAVGVFKIENKIDFLQTYLDDAEALFDIVVQKGISPSKLDKGCLILNTTDTEGPVVLSVDNNQYDAQYWINNFLSVKYADDRNLHTQNYLELCKDFSDEIVSINGGKKEQSEFLAATVDFFKEHESIDIEEFKDKVFEDPKQQESFTDYKKHFEKLNDVLIRNNFEVSDAVFKKEKAKFKAEIKLDTNIQIKIDVDAPDAASEYLEQGYDEDKKMKYYKVFYNAEK